MKKIVKLTKIKKNNHANYTKKAIRKRKSHKKNIFLKKRNFYQIDSPHNTNDYLINNASTPFFNYNDNDNDEESIEAMFMPIRPLYFNNDNNSEMDLFSAKEIESTNEKTIIFNIKPCTDEQK